MNQRFPVTFLTALFQCIKCVYLRAPRKNRGKPAIPRRQLFLIAFHILLKGRTLPVFHIILQYFIRHLNRMIIKKVFKLLKEKVIALFIIFF